MYDCERGWGASVMFRCLVKFLVPFFIAGAFWYFYDTPYDNWSSFKYFCLAAALAIYTTVVLRGRIRDLSVVVATIMLGLAGIEAYSVATAALPIDYRPKGYSVSRPILGWGPGFPGVFHQLKLATRTRRVIFDVDYTIDKNLNRQVISATSGPTIAFFGDSFTFGTGLNDKDTLPQQVADFYKSRVRVLNFGFPGYGPQQFLRALETDMYDKLLRRQTRLVVFEAGSWLVERASCQAGWMLRAPRYKLIGDKPVFQGACYQHWPSFFTELFTNTALYHVFVEGALHGPSHADVDLFIAILARADELVREKYGAPTLILYVRSDDRYLKRSGYTDAKIMQRLREKGIDVIDATLSSKDFPGKHLSIPGDGHPSGVANAARAKMVKTYIEDKDVNLTVATQ